eukprot:605724-Pelagomonas_calceolata.AAC.3
MRSKRSHWQQRTMHHVKDGDDKSVMNQFRAHISGRKKCIHTDALPDNKQLREVSSKEHKWHGGHREQRGVVREGSRQQCPM